MSILKVGMYASNRIGAIPNQNYLTFSSDDPFSIKFNQKSWDGVLEYSLDAQHWYEWDASEISSVGNVLYLRGRGNSVITNGISPTHALIMSSPSNSGINCTGNIMSLLDYISPETAQMGVRCFALMFRGCTNLTTAPELPAMTLAGYCYNSMFNGCTNLTTAPELPATTLATYCYYGMFWGCANLVTAPELPATTLAEYCYYNMFYGCTNLTTASELPATALARSCYYAMFRGCTNLTTAPELPATTLATDCYRDMFYGCTNLTVAPELPSTTLAPSCYQNMFYGCTSIKISSTQTGIYQKDWRIPTVGTGTTAASWNTDMLTGTGGTFTARPAINTTYYQSN